MVREYIGARYVPRFTGAYDPTQIYEVLDVADNGSGTSYILKKPAPAGTPLTDSDYWAIYGAASGAIINLQNQIDDIVADVTALETGKYSTPEQFGAAGDGITDDSTAFQSAVDSSRILLLTGNYLIKDIEIAHPIKIIGLGGVITCYDDASLPFNNIFTVTSDFIIEGVTFEGNIVADATLADVNSIIYAHDCALVDIRKCVFHDIKHNYVNVDVAMYNYTAVLLKCVDVVRTIFDHNIVDTCGGDEIFMITPHHMISSDYPSIEFTNNAFIDCRGASINLFAKDVFIKDNYFYNFVYAGSIFNLSCDYLTVKDNYYDTCDVGSIYDGSEGSYYRVTSMKITGDKNTGNCHSFVITSSKDVIIDNCEIACAAFIINDQATYPTALVCDMLQNTSLKGNSNFIIRNNNININDNGNYGGALIRCGIGIYRTSYNDADTFPKMNSFIISDNFIRFNNYADVPAKRLILTSSLYDTITIENNTFIKPNKDNLAGTVKYILNVDNTHINPTFKSIAVSLLNNSGITETLSGFADVAFGPPSSDPSAKCCSYLNIFNNNMNLLQDCNKADVIRTDIT